MAKQGEKQRLLEIGAEEMWTPFLDEVNDLMIEEKAARHENDHIKLAEICVRIVSRVTSQNLVIASKKHPSCYFLNPPIFEKF
jgi:hypothetical protein